MGGVEEENHDWSSTMCQYNRCQLSMMCCNSHGEWQWRAVQPAVRE